MEIVNFTATDGVMLSGLLQKADSPHSLVISVHGMKNNVINNINTIVGNIVSKNGISFLSFNNRGHDIVSYIERMENGKKIKQLGGAAFEDILEADRDIEGAISYALSLGYSKIYLLGHSLGCTKIVYSYEKFKKNKKNRILESIKGILLLSLVDIIGVQKYFLSSRFFDVLSLAEQKEKEKKSNEWMPNGVFIHPISVKSYLRYFRDNTEIDFADYTNSSLSSLNAISCPLFMRWGTEKEMITQTPEELVTLLHRKITNPCLDISFINGSNHSYIGKEKILAQEVTNFIKSIDKVSKNR